MKEEFSVLPVHVGFIMDGNGRWAKSKGKSRNFGHRKGSEVIEEVLKTCFDAGVKNVTLYAFSTENWNRPKEEVDEILRILDKFIDKYRQKASKGDIRLCVFGDFSRLDENMKSRIEAAVESTKGGKSGTVNIALGYGSRQEITRAIQNIIKDGVTQITDDTLSDYLYTAGQPDVDLIVRTSGEQRLSNFLLYQSAYAELYFTDVLWPDFKREEVIKALRWFEGRHRRFGKV